MYLVYDFHNKYIHRWAVSNFYWEQNDVKLSVVYACFSRHHEVWQLIQLAAWQETLVQHRRYRTIGRPSSVHWLILTMSLGQIGHCGFHKTFIERYVNTVWNYRTHSFCTQWDIKRWKAPLHYLLPPSEVPNSQVVLCLTCPYQPATCYGHAILHLQEVLYRVLSD